MGDWRTVLIDGTCGAEEVEKLKNAIAYDNESFENLHCLTASNGLCALGMWAAERIHRIGNLAERDYTPEDVAEKLRELVKVAPTLRLKVHCGGNYESKDCVATISVAVGEVSVGSPEIGSIPEIPEEQMQANLLGHLRPKP